VYKKVKYKSGKIKKKKARVQIQYLSGKPLKYNLREPGKAHKLLLNIYRDVYEVALVRGAMFKEHDFDISSTTLTRVNDREIIGEAFRKRLALEDYSRAAGRILSDLVGGTSYAKDHLMRDKKSKWVAMADDDRLLEWLADGIKKKGLKKKFEKASSSLERLSYLTSNAIEITNARQELAARAWREGTDGIPERKLKKLDKENVKKIKKKIAEAKKQFKKYLADAKKVHRKTR
jgi:hypothetical protein